MNKKLNIGCGVDYREGFINIDGSSTLKNVDIILFIPKEKLINKFEMNSIDFILCNDFLEHHFHFEAIEILKDFVNVLKVGGQLEIRVPESKFIILNPLFSISKKLTLLFGGQDIPQGNKEMDESREKFPEYFCHKYGWTKQSLRDELLKLNLKIINIRRVGTNVVIKAEK